MATALTAPISETGIDQRNLVTWMRNVTAVLNELVADHATNKTFTDELKTDLTALIADVTAIRSSFNTAMTKLNADGGVTDTDYAAAAALTVTSVASSGAATLTETTVSLTS